MKIADLVRVMSAAGAPPEAIALAIEAIEQAQSKDADRRERQAERKRQSRSRSRDGHGTVTGQSGTVTGQPPSPQAKEPPTPQENSTPLYPPDSLRSSDARTPDLFDDEFWPTYPNKVGKPDARKAYDRAVKRSRHSDIMTGLHRYVANKPADRSWMNPATFLNQDRWADEPAAPAPQARAGPGSRPESYTGIAARIAREFHEHRTAQPEYAYADFQDPGGQAERFDQPLLAFAGPDRNRH